MLKQTDKPLIYCCYPSSALKFAGFIHEYVILKEGIPIDFVAMVDNTRRIELYIDENEIIADSITVMLRCDELWVFGDEISNGMQKEINAWKDARGNVGIKFISWQKCGVPKKYIKAFYRNRDRLLEIIKALEEENAHLIKGVEALGDAIG